MFGIKALAGRIKGALRVGGGVIVLSFSPTDGPIVDVCWTCWVYVLRPRLKPPKVLQTQSLPLIVRSGRVGHSVFDPNLC